MYHEIFQAAVKENPESIAAQIEDGAALTYAQLMLGKASATNLAT